MALNGNGDEANGYNTKIKNGLLNDADMVKAVIPPIGTIMPWLKTFGEADSGTTDSTTANKLVESGQNFTTTIDVGMIVHNTTDDTFANVTAVDSDTQLSLDADIMTSGEAYVIYKTPQLPDGWVECDGSVLNDSDSPYDGETIPDLISANNRFLRGNTSSGGTGGSLTHKHSISSSEQYTSGTKYGTSNPTNIQTNTSNHEPPYYDVVWIMRVK